MRSPALEARGVGVEVEGVRLLDGVDLEAEAGQLVALVGPNGAGKSTLLRALDGLLPLLTGSIRVGGRPLAEMDRREMARQIAFVPQADTRMVPFEVRDFVEMGRHPHLGPWQSPGPEDRRAVEEAMELTGTSRLAGRDMRSLSGGERQLVFIAAALAQGGRVLLLDEPTTFLDYRHQAEVVELMGRLHRRRGLAVVAATHDLNTTAAAADRVVALRDGRLVFAGSPAELVRPQRLREIFATEFELVDAPDRALPLVIPRSRLGDA